MTTNKTKKDIVPVDTVNHIVEDIISEYKNFGFHFKKSVEHYLKVSTTLYKLDDMKDQKLKNEVRKKLVLEKNIMSETTFHKLIKIGKKNLIFDKYSNQLPHSYHSLHQLAITYNNDDEKLEELFKRKLITSDSTIEDIKKLKLNDGEEFSGLNDDDEDSKDDTAVDPEKIPKPSISISFKPKTITGQSHEIKRLMEELENAMRSYRLGAKIEYKGLLKKRLEDEL
tara:strand:- start:20 stop:697 length:678 start_codon:yes stop_codon:yes gene_type:complete